MENSILEAGQSFDGMITNQGDIEVLQRAKAQNTGWCGTTMNLMQKGLSLIGVNVG